MVNRAWPNVTLHRTDKSPSEMMSGDSLNIEVTVELGELTADDVVLECIIGTAIEAENIAFHEHEHVKLSPKGKDDDGNSIFGIHLVPPLPGLQFYKLRLYPSHPLLSHRFETGLIRWL